MNKKIMLTLAGISMAIGLTSTASAGDSLCDTAKWNANFYCNAIDPDQQLCSYWLRASDRCGPREV